MGKPPLADWMDKYLQEKGAVAEVGPDYYTGFLAMDDKRMGAIISGIIYGLSKEINRMLGDENGEFNDDDILELVQNTLSLVAVGQIRFGPNGTLCFFKCEGPEPTPEVQDLLNERVAKSLPLIRRAFIEILNS